MTSAQSFLDEFLKHQLLDIGDDDGRFANLQAASAAVCESLKTDLWQLARYTRVGLDKDIDPNEPVLDEIETAIKEHWKLIRNKHTERPVSIIRAVLWESLRCAVDGDAHAAVVALTAKAESEDANLGPEARACQQFLNQLLERVEGLAEAEWSGQKELAATSENTKPTPINAELLAEKLLAASGPEGSDGAIKGANPHWPAANTAWSSEFSQRAAKGIAEVVGGHAISAQNSLAEIAQNLAEEIQKARLAVSRKTDLLWWHQSKFCIIAESGFGDISTTALPFLLAADAQLLAPGLCPQSVDHFLAHVVQAAAPKAKKTTVHEMIEAVVQEDFKATVAAAVEDIPIVDGRCGILGAVKCVLDKPASVDQVVNRLSTGSKEIKLPTLAKRVFWELKAKSIAASAQPGANDE